MSADDDSFEVTSFDNYLINEKICASEISDESIFEQLSRLADSPTTEKSVDEIIKEAETLISYPQLLPLKLNFKDVDEYFKSTNNISCESTPCEMKPLGLIDRMDNSLSGKLLDDVFEDEEKTIVSYQNQSVSSSCPSSPETISSMKSKKNVKSSSAKKLANFKKKASADQNNKENKMLEDSLQLANLKNEIKEPSKSFRDKSTAPSPTHSMMSVSMSSSTSMTWVKEHELQKNIDDLEEKLKDSEERFESTKLQHHSLATVHRVLRENHTQLQEDFDKLKIDVQHLNECANLLRSELVSARTDRDAAKNIQGVLQQELDDSRAEKKKLKAATDRDAKVIQDLQRSTKEMERILARKHPDSVSALIVANKSSSSNNDNSSIRKVLEKRIAQLEDDAKQQDVTAKNILASVQSRFNSVQGKYEAHIEDLETQVLSLQEINAKLNQKLHEKSEELMMKNTSQICSSTQTMDRPEREKPDLRTIATQTEKEKHSGVPRSVSSSAIPKRTGSKSDLASEKEDAHLMATLRGMRVELAIKEKACIRLNRDLDESKKTVKKLQKERDSYLKNEKPDKSGSAGSKKVYDPSHYTENFDQQAMKHAMDKIRMMEMDFKALYEKRVQDLKILQTAHERELAACHETVRILQDRLKERDAVYAHEKRRNGPIDYYALKAKVSSLERRHSEREERLHLLVEALSKGKINGIHQNNNNDIISENYESMSPHSCSSPINKNL